MTGWEVAAFVVVICAVPALLVGLTRSPGPRLDGLEPAGPATFHGREGRRFLTTRGGRELVVYVRSAMSDLYCCVEVPLSPCPTGPVELDAVEAFGFTSARLGEGTLAYTGSDRWRMLHDPLHEHPALDDGPRLEGDGRRVHVRLEDQRLLVGFRQVTDERLPGILDAMCALAEAIEARLRRPWDELAEAHGLVGGYGLLCGEIDGVPVRVEPEQVRLGHGLDLPEGIVVAHKERLDGEALGDPVLDLCLRTTAPWSVEPQAAEALLEVLHGRPGSRLTTEELEVRIVGEELEPALLAGLRLVEALR